MHFRATALAALLAHLHLSGVSATPAPTYARLEVVPDVPAITPSPTLNEVTKALQNRGILDDITSGLKDITSALGSGIPDFVTNGIQKFEVNLPVGTAVRSSLGLEESQVAALPTQVLNLPPYANWTDQGWNVRFHGNVYKQPNTTKEKLDDLADVFLIGTDIQDLQPSEQDMARNVTAAIFVVQQGNVQVANITLSSENGTDVTGDPANKTGSGPASGGTQQIRLPYNTTDEGDFDTFVQIPTNGLTAGNATNSIQKLAVHINNATLGNATAYLVPPTGLSIISDIDDILRVTKIYAPKEGILNSFARPYTVWENMNEIYAEWARTIPNTHFHYLTTLPEQVTRNYMDFIYRTYPGGSFDTRPLNFSDVSATLAIRKYLLDKYFATFPKRKIVLVADTSNSDVMKDYPQLAHDYPDRVACIFLRNTSATDSQDNFPYNTDGFKGLPQKQYMFFVHANDLRGLDIANGNCYNTSVAQNLTFRYQGLPKGLGAGAVNGSANNQTGAAAAGRVTDASTAFRAALVTLIVLAVAFSFL